MDRREALKALVSLPATARVSVAQLKPEDVIVIECEEKLSRAGMERIHETALKVWPERKVVVLDAGLKLRIAQG